MVLHTRPSPFLPPAMRAFAVVLFLLGAVISLACGQRDDGYTDAVQWDNGSLFVNGERVFIYSGEFHHARLPVPELWRDVFQKFKANGLNTIR